MKKVALVFSAYAAFSTPAFAACIVGENCDYQQWKTEQRVNALENTQRQESWQRTENDRFDPRRERAEDYVARQSFK